VADDTASQDPSSEQKMRRALEARRGTPFTETEWEEAKRNLVGVFLTLGLDAASPIDGEDSDSN
jgi:hypothetical protein